MVPFSALTALAALVAGLLIVAVTHVASRRFAKPRFVVALCLVAVAIAVAELVELFASSTEDYGHVWFGIELAGTWARVAGIADIAIYLVGAVGLWLLRPWARLGAMAYLLYLLVSFVIWGVRDAGGHGVLVVMAWQMFVLPFITFSLMYLQRGASDFGARQSTAERKTGWLY